jgi:hypothetical protein
LGIIGIHRSSDVAWCLALEDGPGAVLGRWLTLEDPRGESIELRCGSHYRRLPQEAWSDWELPIPRAGEVVILPSPRLRALPSLVPGSDFSITTAFDTLILKLGNEIPHQTVQ